MPAKADKTKAETEPSQRWSISGPKALSEEQRRGFRHPPAAANGVLVGLPAVGASATRGYLFPTLT